MKNELKFTGVVVDIRPVQVITSTKDASKSYKKQEIVLEEDGEQYPNSILLEVFDKLEKLDGVKMGDTVEAIYNTKARAWEKNGKSGVMCANSIWKITVTQAAAPFVSAADPYPAAPAAAPSSGNDDLPF